MKLAGGYMYLLLERDNDCEDCPGWLRWRVVRRDLRSETENGAMIEQRQVLHHSITKTGAKLWVLWNYPGMRYHD